MSLLSVEQLSVGFVRYDGLVNQSRLEILQSLSFAVERGEFWR